MIGNGDASVRLNTTIMLTLWFNSFFGWIRVPRHYWCRSTIRPPRGKWLWFAKPTIINSFKIETNTITILVCWKVSRHHLDCPPCMCVHYMRLSKFKWTTAQTVSEQRCQWHSLVLRIVISHRAVKTETIHVWRDVRSWVQCGCTVLAKLWRLVGCTKMVSRYPKW